jgi:hypothetical protein
MSQVFLHLSFRNAEHPSQLIGRHPGIGQKIDDALTRGPFERRHARMVKDRVEEKPDDLKRFSANHLKSCVLKSCTDGSILSKSVPAFNCHITINPLGRPVLVS